MALGGIVLYVNQNLNEQPVLSPTSLISAGEDYTVELRVRFPLATDDVLPPSSLSGALWTLSSGTTGPSYLSLWYEKSSLASTTGNLYLTSSAGQLVVLSASIFDDSFYSVVAVREHRTGSLSLYVTQYSDGELVYSTSSVTLSTTIPTDVDYKRLELGSSIRQASAGEFWAHEMRLWTASLDQNEVVAHAADFLSYGRDSSYRNQDLLIHWRMDDGQAADPGGSIYLADSAFSSSVGTGSNFSAGDLPFTKFLEDYSYIPSIDYGWNQKKIRVFSGSIADPLESYEDERFVSLEFNMVDALNEDISHLMTSYDELVGFIGLPVNRYREEYEGLLQMRETYFKRLQGQLNFRVFADMLDFFDRSFIQLVQRLIPARSIFKGDEFIIESHMLERPKFQYQLRPIQDGLIDISGSISVVDRDEATW